LRSSSARRICAWPAPSSSGCWKTCIERYDRPHTFFYLDPPYWQTEGYGGPFPFEEYEAIAAAFRSLKGKAMMSINDHPALLRGHAHGVAGHRLHGGLCANPLEHAPTHGHHSTRLLRPSAISPLKGSLDDRRSGSVRQ
jgi:hypothetical protein